MRVRIGVAIIRWCIRAIAWAAPRLIGEASLHFGVAYELDYLDSNLHYAWVAAGNVRELASERGH